MNSLLTKIFALLAVVGILTTSSKSIAQETYASDTSNQNRPLRKATFQLIPSNYLLQYAGSIGLFSIGTGWDYGKRKQWNTDFIVGYVPKYDFEKPIVTLTLRETYSPWSTKINTLLDYQPLRIGVYFTSSLGEEFWRSLPDKYPTGYYKFSTKLRFQFFLGQNFTFKFKKPNSYFESIKLYYDIHSNDLYFMSRRDNKYLSGKDYIGLALGMKLQIRRQ